MRKRNLPKLNLIEIPSHRLYRKMHTDFKVSQITSIGANRWEVHWSAMFGGMKTTDYIVLYADDELDAYRLAMQIYGE